MAYKLLDQNGNYMEINGMHKGTIISPYVYNGMELYNENAIASNRYPFYSIGSFRVYRRVRIGSSYYYPGGTTKEYVDEAYSATEIAINGRYSNSSYKNYEVYKDGNLVASGSFTNSATDIYVCQKEANTSIIVSGIWDETNSKFIYNITTNATINRQNTYKWDNSESVTLDFYQCNAGYIGSNRPITSITDTKVTFYNDPNIATLIKNYYGCDEVIINSITDQFYVYNAGTTSYFFNVYDDSGTQLTEGTLVMEGRSEKVQVTRPSGASYYTGKYGSSSTSTSSNFNSSNVKFDIEKANISIVNQTIYNVTLKFYPKKPVMKQFTFESNGRMYCDGFFPTNNVTTISSPSNKLNWCDNFNRSEKVYIYLNNTLINTIPVTPNKENKCTIDVSEYTSIECTRTGSDYHITAT